MAEYSFHYKLPQEESINRIVETIKLLCAVPAEDLRYLAFEYYKLSPTERMRWNTLEDWLLAKGYEKTIMNQEADYVNAN